jgi:hypothetical protein
MLRERPLVYVEGTKNIAAHRPYELEIPPVCARSLAKRPGGVLLMITSTDPQIVALTGIPLRQTINESDLEIYRDALAAPAAHAALCWPSTATKSTRPCTLIPPASPSIAAFPRPASPRPRFTSPILPAHESSTMAHTR